MKSTKWLWYACVLVAIGSSGACDDSASVRRNTAFVALDASYHYTCGRTADGTVYCWGKFYDDDSVLSADEPTRVQTPAPFAQISVGWAHQCGLTQSGEAYCWGKAGWNLLGTGDEPFDGVVEIPVRVAGDARYSMIDAGIGMTCGVALPDGQLWCWGGVESPQPEQRWARGGFVKVASGRDVGGCAIDVDSRLWCWGTALTGEAPDSLVNVAPVMRFRDITVGGWDLHACAVSIDRTAYCWGRNWQGSLGDGTGADEIPTPTAVATSHRYETVQTFSWMTCGLTVEGNVDCWGYRPDTGDGPNQRSDVPITVSNGLVFESVSVGMDYFCGLVQGGRVYCLGNPWSFGQEASPRSTVPVRIPDPQ